MALRSLDNALPTTPERPKKQARVSLLIQQSHPPAVNDENKAPLPPTNADPIDYISSDNLKPFPDPDIKIQSLIEELESKDWLKVCDSLNDVRRFAIHHSPILVPFLGKVMLIVVKSMKNPRSALIKTSIMASSDIFKSYGDTLLDSTISDALDHMMLQLLMKASQDKKFVCEEAEKALKTMVESMTPLLLLHKLKAYVTHANPRIRAKAAVSVSHCLSKMELDGMKEYGLVELIQMGAKLLNDRLPEAREAARSMVMMMHNLITEKEEEKDEVWQNFCHSNLAAIDAQAFVKIVIS